MKMFYVFSSSSFPFACTLKHISEHIFNYSLISISAIDEMIEAMIDDTSHSMPWDIAEAELRDRCNLHL